jgi:mxaA protein
MRVVCIGLLFAMMASLALADDSVVAIHVERHFGYFVGDLIRARVDVRAPAGASLLRASLPHPGAVTPYLDLCDSRVEETAEAEGPLWRLFLTYQNFYVALDVRDIVIPKMDLDMSIDGGVREIAIPAWKIGVAPLREVLPASKENAEDYLRPDGDPLYHFDAAARLATNILGALTLLSVLGVARDHAWFPFRQRRARRFSRLARRFLSKRGPPQNIDGLRARLLEMHEVFDATYGRTLLESEVGAFLDRHEEFAPLADAFGRFFALSREAFFGRASRCRDDDHEWLASFVAELAKRERAR